MIVAEPPSLRPHSGLSLIACLLALRRALPPPSVPVATKIAHFFGWEVEETIAWLMKDLFRQDDTGA